MTAKRAGARRTAGDGGPGGSPARSARSGSGARPSAGRTAGAQRREEILRIAMETFAARGYHNASLAEISERAGLTQAGVLHHFPSKAALLTGVLELRDRSEAGGQDDPRPRGLEFLRHLVGTVRRNEERAGIVRLYAVLSAESVTEGHPAQEYFRGRYSGLRELVAEALREAAALDELPADADRDGDVAAVAAAIVAVMDGLQVQWLLDPDAVDMAAATQRTIDALLDGLIRRPPPG